MVSFVDFYDDDPNYYYMVLEFMAGGELFGRIVEKVGFCMLVRWTSIITRGKHKVSI